MPTATVFSTVPHSAEAELTVLGALLLDPDAIFMVAARLKADDFYDPIHREIYGAIRKLSEEGIAVDFITVANKLQDAGVLDRVGGSAFLAKLANDVPTASHIDHYADIVLEKSRRRGLAVIGKKLAELAQEDAKSSDELTEIAECEFLALSRPHSDERPTALGDMRTERYEHYVRLYDSDDENAIAGVRTGFADLDQKVTSLAPGQLVVLAGRPGMGKTAFALDIARNAVEQGRTVAFFSLEMSKEEVFDRLFSRGLGVEAWKLSRGLLTEEQASRMGSVFDQFSNLKLFIDDDHNSDLINIRSKARRHQLQHGLDLLIVDYLQLIEVTDRSAGENQTQRITYISKSLKRLARELHCPVLALSQLSRECDRRPQKQPLLSDLRDSGSIEQDGDKILMLYRESEYNPDCDNPALTDLYIRKNRNGPTGQIELNFDKTRMTFRDHPRGQRPAPAA